MFAAYETAMIVSKVITVQYLSLLRPSCSYNNLPWSPYTHIVWPVSSVYNVDLLIGTGSEWNLRQTWEFVRYRLRQNVLQPHIWPTVAQHSHFRHWYSTVRYFHWPAVSVKHRFDLAVTSTTRLLFFATGLQRLSVYRIYINIMLSTRR